MEIPHGQVKPGEWERELRRDVDDNLRLRFSDENGKWGVYEVKPWGEWTFIRWVQTPDGRFRGLDRSVILDALRFDARRREKGLLSVVEDLKVANDRLHAEKKAASRRVLYDVREDAKRELRRFGKNRVFYRPVRG